MNRLIALLALLLSLPLSACADALGPEERVAGAYEATLLLVQEDAATFDALEAGAELELFLHEDGSSTGHLFVPGGEEDGADFAADLAGRWTVEGDRVTLDNEADTFLRDMTLRVQGNRLAGELGGIRLVLSRQ